LLTNSNSDPSQPPLHGHILSSDFSANVLIVCSQNEKTLLLGKTKQDYAQIVRWMSFSNSEVLPPIGNWFRPLIGKDPYNKKNVEDAKAIASKALAALENHFLVNTWLVGQRLTLADLTLASQISRGFQYVLDKQWRSENPNVTRWYETVVNQPIWKAVVEKPIFVEEAVKYTPPKKDPKPAAAPKAAAPKAAAAAEEEDDTPAEPKPAKHPLEALGKPTLILDDWKRKYSNFETRTEALPWFWENYKPDEYSLWRVDYKYNDELTMTFMSANLVGK
jgi:elongation factor 1-gamma